MGKIKFQDQSEPNTPESGRTYLYVDSADKIAKIKDDTGTVTELITDPTKLVLTPQSDAPGTGDGLVYYDSITGFQFRESGRWMDLSGMENYWKRIGTEISPLTAADDLNLGTGKLLMGDAEIIHANEIHPPIYLSGQSGLNDLTLSGTYSLDGNATFQFMIDGTGSPNTFKWRKDAGAWTTGVPMSLTPILLQDGIYHEWGSLEGHTNKDEWAANVGHEIHISESLHISDDLWVDGNITFAGTMNSFSPVKIQEAIMILCDKPTDTAILGATCTSWDFELGGTPLLTLENDGTLVARTSNYENLVLEDNDIPNRRFVMDNAGGGINKTTGWLEGAQVTINATDDTKIDISPGSVQIVTGTDTPIVTIISWDETITFDPQLSSYTNWIGIKDDGSGGPEVVSQILFDSVERRTTALLGKVRDAAAGTGPHITNIDDFERPAWGITTAFHDFILAHGSFSIKGNVIGASDTDPLCLTKTSGESYRYHTEDIIGRENHHLDAAQFPRRYYSYHIQGLSQLVIKTTIDPLYMDDGAQGVKLVGNNKYTRQAIRIWPVSGAFHISYGQTEYGSLQEAIDAGPEPMAEVNTRMTNGAIHINDLIIKQNVTDIAAAIIAGTAVIVSLGGTGGSSGGGGLMNVVDDITPQLGGNLDVLTKNIFSSTVGNVVINDKLQVNEDTLIGTGIVAYGSGLTIANNDPHLYLYESNAAINNRLWDIVATDESLLFRAVNDINSLAENFMYVERTGYTIDNVIFPNGKVIIGATSSASNLHVQENIAGTNAKFTLYHSDNTSTDSGAILNLVTVDATGGNPFIVFSIANVGDWGMGVDNADDDKFKIGTTADISANNAITIDRNHNVGFGTTDPDRMVHVKGANANFHLERESSSGASFFFSNVNGANTTHWKMEAVQNGAGAGSGVFKIADDGTDSGGTSTVRLTIDENGNIGFGSHTPSVGLHASSLTKGSTVYYTDIAAAFEADASDTGQIGYLFSGDSDSGGDDDVWFSLRPIPNHNHWLIGARFYDDTDGLYFNYGDPTVVTWPGEGTPNLILRTNGNMDVSGYTKLGIDAPAIKTKKLTGTTSSSEGGLTSVAHGLTGSKILSVSLGIEFTTDGFVTYGYTTNVGYQSSLQWDDTNITVSNHATNSENILSKPLVILVTYEE